MVYYLRPRRELGKELSYKLAGKDELLSTLLPYLIMALIVTVLSVVVILYGVKPDMNGFSFLCVKDEEGKHKVSNMRVFGLSLLLGVLVALAMFGLNKVNPDLLDTSE